MRRVPKKERAVSAASFALIAPVLFLVLMGIMEGGRVLSAWLVITNEAREGARLGAVRFGDGTPDEQAQRVRAYLAGRLAGVLASDGLVPAPLVVIRDDATGRAVEVTVSYRVPLTVPVVRSVLPDPFPLAARSTMRGE